MTKHAWEQMKTPDGTPRIDMHGFQAFACTRCGAEAGMPHTRSANVDEWLPIYNVEEDCNLEIVARILRL